MLKMMGMSRLDGHMFCWMKRPGRIWTVSSK